MKKEKITSLALALLILGGSAMPAVNSFNSYASGTDSEITEDINEENSDDENKKDKNKDNNGENNEENPENDEDDKKEEEENDGENDKEADDKGSEDEENKDLPKFLGYDVLPDDLKEATGENGSVLKEAISESKEDEVSSWELISSDKKKDTKSNSLTANVKESAYYKPIDFLAEFDCSAFAGSDFATYINAFKDVMDKQDSQTNVWVSSIDSSAYDRGHEVIGPMNPEQAKQILEVMSTTGNWMNRSMQQKADELGVHWEDPKHRNLVDYYNESGVDKKDQACLIIMAESKSQADEAHMNSWAGIGDKGHLFIPVDISDGSSGVLSQFSSHENYLHLPNPDGSFAQAVADQVESTLERNVDVSELKVHMEADSGVTIEEAKLVLPDGSEVDLPIEDNKVDYQITPESGGDVTVKYTISGETDLGDTKGIKAEIIMDGEVASSASDTLIPGLDETKQRVTKKYIPYKVKYIADDSLKQGEFEVENEGVLGFSEITEQIDYKDGSELSESLRTVDTQITDPVDAVIRVGTKIDESDINIKVVPNKESIKDEGEEVEFTVTITNTGESKLEKVEVENSLTVGLNGEEDTDNYTAQALEKDVLEKGESISYKVKYSLQSSDLEKDLITNKARVKGIGEGEREVADEDFAQSKILYEAPVVPKPQPKPEPKPVVIEQEGDKQVIIVNKDKKDDINIDNSDKEEITNDIKKTKTVKNDEDCETPAKAEKLEKPMQNTGVANATNDASGMFAVISGLLLGLSKFFKRK